MCTKNYNVRAQRLFRSSNLLFADVLVAVAVVFCARSLMVRFSGRLNSTFRSTRQRASWRGCALIFFLLITFTSTRDAMLQ